MKRATLLVIVAVVLCTTPAMAVNSVNVPDLAFAPGATGVEIPVQITNDVSIKGLVVPLILRDVNPGGFPTQLAIRWRDRLPRFGPMNEIVVNNHYNTEDGTQCRTVPGGFKTPIAVELGGQDTLSIAVTAAPWGVQMVRNKLFSPSLAAGSDQTGSILLIADIGAADGTFEVDTTCVDPANHLVYVDDLNAPIAPTFSKGTITVGDGGGSQNTPPVAVCQDIAVDADSNCQVASINSSLLDGGSFDAEDDSTLLTFEVVPGGPYVLGPNDVRLIVTDTEGDTSSCAAVITVVDNTPPQITCPGPITVECADDVPAPDTSLVTATDNCGDVTVTHVGDSPLDPDGCGGTITRTYRATDAAGNFAECTQIITVDDTQAPVITCPDNIVVQEDSPGSGAVVNFANATAVDNCDPSPSIVQIEGQASGSTFAAGVHTISFEAADECGNTDTCSFTITVEPGTSEVVAVCQNITVDADANCEAAVTPDQVDGGSTGSNITLSLNPPGPFALGGPHTVWLVVEDEFGTKDSCEATITVEDNTPPTIDCPSNITVQEDAPGEGAVVNYSDPTYDDNCGATLSQIAGLPSGSTFPVGTTTNTFEVTDDAGNTAQCSFNVTVTEGVPEVNAVCQNVTVEADANCQAEVAPADVDNGSSGSNITLSLNPPGPYALGSNDVWLVVEDEFGTKDSCAATITVEDNTAPVITCPSVESPLVADENCQWEVPSYDPQVDENCTVELLVQNPPGGTLLGLGTHEISLVVYDQSGNKDSCAFSVTVEDTTPPTIECPADITVPEDAPGAGAVVNYSEPTYDDNCGATLSQIAGLPSGSTFPVGMTMIAFRATDDAGNVAECSFTVTVDQQSDGPSLTIDEDSLVFVVEQGTTPPPQTVHVTSSPDPVSYQVFVGAIPVLKASETLVDSILVEVTVNPSPGMNSTRESKSQWPHSLTSNAGIEISVDPDRGTTPGFFQVFVNIGDSEPGSYFDVIYVVEAQEVSDPVNPACKNVTVDADANCEADVSPAEVDNGSTGSNITLSLNPPGPYALGPNDVWLVVEDEFGNRDSCAATIMVVDNTPPVITCPEDITVQIPLEESDAVVFYDDPTFTDNCGAAIIQIAGLPSGTTFPFGTTTNTFVAVDENENADTCSFDVTVERTGTPGTISVHVDIKPQSCPNPLNTKAQGKGQVGGVLPVAILGTSEFDVSDIDPSTILLEGIAPLRWSYEDVTAPYDGIDECGCAEYGPDGYTDLTLKFNKADFLALLDGYNNWEQVSLTLTGELWDGTLISGHDCVSVLAPKRAATVDLPGSGDPSGIGLVNHPNPFNAGTVFSYSLSEPGHVTLAVYNILGQEIIRLVDEHQAAGQHSIEWNGRDSRGRDVSTGVYLSRIIANQTSVSKKLMLLK
jgi:hypothetical protein